MGIEELKRQKAELNKELKAKREKEKLEKDIQKLRAEKNKDKPLNKAGKFIRSLI